MNAVNNLIPVLHLEHSYTQLNHINGKYYPH